MLNHVHSYVVLGYLVVGMTICIIIGIHPLYKYTYSPEKKRSLLQSIPCSVS
jgi:hypothetical protein